MRWIPYARVSLQRAGSIIAVIANARDSTPTSVSALSIAYSRQLRRRVAIDAERAPAVFRYLQRQRLWKRYRDLQHIKEPELLTGHRIELQDLWLADPRVLSASGAITDDVIEEPTQLAVNLRLLRARNHTLTDRGKALRVAASREVQAIAEGDPKENPFVIGAPAAVLLLFSLVDEDGDFLQAAYEVALRDLGDSFTRTAFSEALAEACDALRQKWIPRARTGTDRRKISDLKQLAKKIQDARETAARKKPRSGRTWGGGRPPDQAATLRLEPLVDLRLLHRQDRFEYRYTVDASQRSFFESLLDAEVAEEFVFERLFGSYLRALGETPTKLDDGAIWPEICIAYEQLKSGLGYAAFREVIALANAHLAPRRLFFELSDGLRVLSERRKQEPGRIRFGVKRGGGVSYVRILKAKENT